MAEPNFSYAEQPPWLRNDAQYDSRPFELGFNAAQRNKDREPELRRLKMAEAEFPYRQKILQQESEMNQYRLDDALRERDILLEAERDARALGAIADDLLQDGKPLEAYIEHLRAAGRNGNLWSSKTFNTRLNAIGTAVKSLYSAERLADITARHRLELEKAQEDKLPASEISNREIDKLKGQARLLRSEGDIAGAEIAEEQAQRRQESLVRPFAPKKEQTEEEYVLANLDKHIEAMKPLAGQAMSVEQAIAQLREAYRKTRGLEQQPGETPRQRFIFDSKAGALK